MLPAIFAVLLLGHFVAAEIYVGQNPQNVNAVIKDANGNLIPVTGVADEIVVVDLNYGGEESSSGMSVDVSVSPVNGSSSSSPEYPSYGGYSSQLGLSSPSSSAPGAVQTSSPPISAAPVSLPSSLSGSASAPPATAPPASASPSNPLNPFGSMFGGSGSSGASGSAPSLFNPLGTGSSAAAPQSSNLTPPPSSPVSEYDNMVSNMNSGSHNTNSGASSPPAAKNPFAKNPFAGLSSLFGGKKSGNPKSNNPSSFSFIELGGALGPVDDTQDNITTGMVNNTPSVASVPLTPALSGSFGNLTPFNILGSLPKFNGTIPPFSSRNSSIPMFNMSNFPMFNTSSFSTPSSLPNFLNSLLGSSSMNLQSLSSPSFSGMMNSFFNPSSSGFNPMNSSASPLTSIMGPFLNSFMNASSMLNSSNMMDSLNDMMSSFGNESLNPLSNVMDMIMNTTTSMFNSNSSSSPFTSLLNSFLNGSSSIFSSMGSSGSPLSNLFPNSAIGSPFSNMLTMPSGNSAPNVDLSSLNSKNDNSQLNKFMNSMVKTMMPSNTMNLSSISNMMAPFLNFTNGNNTSLKDMMQNMLPFNIGDNSDYYDYLEDGSGDSDDSDEDDDDYYNPLQSLLPPQTSAKALSKGNPSSNPSTLNMPSTLDDINDMVNTLLTPSKNGTTPFTTLLENTFGGNGTSFSPTNLFGQGGLLNPMTYNTTQPVTISFKNPLSNWEEIISSMNSTGLFGDLSDLSEVTQNLSSIISQSWNNTISKSSVIGQAMSIFPKIMKDVSTAFQTFITNISSKQTSKNTTQPIPQSQPFPPVQLPLMGSSFLAIPSSPPAPAPAIPALTDTIPLDAGMLNDAPQPQSEPTTSETTPSQNETTPVQSTSSTSTSPPPSSTDQSNSSAGTPTPSPPTKAPGVNPSSVSSGINLSSTWITLVGCLIVAFSQKNFLGLF